MGAVETFFWTILGAVISAVVSLGIPTFMARLENRKRAEIFREWESEYQGIDEPDGTWVSEKVKVDLAGGKIRFKNSDSSEGYDYTAIGRLVHRSYIVGDWVSIRPGANACGCFMLTLSSQGDVLYGYWVGNDVAGSRRYGRWVLAKDKTSIARAKGLLDQMRKSRLPAPKKTHAN